MLCRSIWAFYVALMTKIVKKLPLNDPILKSLGVLCPAQKLDHTAESGEWVIKIVSHICQRNSTFVCFLLQILLVGQHKSVVFMCCIEL